MELTQEYLKSILHYDPETGLFTWLVRKSQRARIGSVAGGINVSNGYWQIRIDGEHYLGHQLAWFYMTGDWPLGEMDHKDTNRSNNKFSNLREATHSQSGMNRRGWSGRLKGTYYHEKKDAWRAYICVDNKYHHLGYYKTQEEAHVAYVAAARKFHKEFCHFDLDQIDGGDQLGS